MTPERERRLPLLLAGCVLCAILAGVLFAFVVSMTYDPTPGTEAPKVTDWMQGWGSLAGVLAGAAAAVAAAWLLLHERQQTREAREQLRVERAETESTAARAVIVRRPKLDSINGKQILEIIVDNFGAAPIRNLFAVVETTSAWIPTSGVEVVEPGGSARLLGLPDRVGLAKINVPRFRSVTLMFFDASGQRWIRTNNAEPEKVDTLPEAFSKSPERANWTPGTPL